MESITPTSPLTRRPLEHLSYSSLSTLLTCGKQFELTRLVRAPKKPSVWLAGGLGVHGCTEDFDRAQLSRQRFDPAESWRRNFMEAIDRLKQDDPDISTWRQKETVAEWMTLGPKLCVAYFKWRTDSPWSIWVTPDGEPAIELDTSGLLPGCPVEVKQYVDRVFVNNVTRTPFLVDIKTGTRQPENSLQFGVYRAGIEARYGVVVPQGAAFMNRKGQLGRVHDLAKYTPDYIGAQMGRAAQIIKGGNLIANPGGHCFFCDVSTSCHAKDGPLAHVYDRDAPNNIAPF